MLKHHFHFVYFRLSSIYKTNVLIFCLQKYLGHVSFEKKIKVLFQFEKKMRSSYIEVIFNLKKLGHLPF